MRRFSATRCPLAGARLSHLSGDLAAFGGAVPLAPYATGGCRILAQMSTFGLVHGSGHGAWCWERLTPRLAALGHHALAMDLPCEDPAAGALHYAEVVDRALPRADDLILVGHSLGGLTIPLVAARRPVRRLVFLCALIPEFGRSLTDQIAANPELLHPDARSHRGRVTDPDGTVWLRDAAAARGIFYHDCSTEDVNWAFARLPPKPRSPGVSRAPWRAGPRATGLCALPRGSSHLTRRVAPRSARRLGIEPIELDGGHSPFL